jgi:Mn2+/Fe2+ NRAMP family transporter
VDVDPSRLRRGEVVAGGGALVLALALFLLPVYGVTSTFAPTLASESQPTSFDGWHSLLHLRWLVLVTILVAFALVWFQSTRRAPAIPVTCSVLVTVFSLLTALALFWRVLIDPPGGYLEVRYGGYVALVASLAMFYGGYLSMREEGLPARDARTDVETVRLGGS